MAFAGNYGEGMGQYSAAADSENLTAENTNDVDIFSVRVAPGADYRGYIFRLTADAMFSLEEAENIRALSLVLNIFHAATMQDIIDFAAPEMIMYIEPNYVSCIDPMPVGQPAPLTFAPHAFVDVDDPYYHDQWGLEFIRGAAAWSTEHQKATHT